jgi:hypothetical protein
MERSELIDFFTDALIDSAGPDWTCTDGAEAIVAQLDREGRLKRILEVFDANQIVAEPYPCPRCHQKCGWCGDYRHMHSLLALPGSKGLKCGVTDFAPEGDNCPMCHGVMSVVRVTHYRPLSDDSQEQSA